MSYYCAINDPIHQMGFAHIPDTGLQLEIREDQIPSFKTFWSDLVVDENFKNFMNRKRKILRYFYRPGGALIKNTNSVYEPQGNYDIDYVKAGNHLTYVENMVEDHPIMQAIIQYDLGTVLPFLNSDRTYAFDIHLFRVEASNGKSSPTTSGIHQDGVDWLFMHFVDAFNTRPVLSEIHEEEQSGTSIFQKQLNDFLETMMVDDHRVWHRAGPVVQIDTDIPAYRDMLIITLTDKGKAADQPL